MPNVKTIKMYSPVTNSPYFLEITPKPYGLRQVAYGSVSKGKKVPDCAYICPPNSPNWKIYYRSIADNLRKLEIAEPNLTLLKVLLNIK